MRNISATTKALGIHQSDVIIRSAIVEGIADLRRNPWLLDYVFASLAQDELTKKAYGESEISQAKKWFLKTDIPVFMDTRVGSAKLPAITIGIQESVEDEKTHGDVHYEVSEETEAEWPLLAGPFSPTSYVAATGTMTVPTSITDELVLTPGMFVVDGGGTSHLIVDVVLNEDFSPPVFEVSLAPGTVADFRNAVIKGSKPKLITTLESLSFRETYSIECVVDSQVIHATYLHSIVVFILLRYKQTLLEARGFERSTISSQKLSAYKATENELAFSRMMAITGYVRQYWPKSVDGRVDQLATGMTAGIAGSTGDLVDTGDQLWDTEEDALLFRPVR